jgi:ribosome maturation factor RimP
VDIKASGNRDKEKVLVFIDSDNGVRIDQCAKIARSLSRQLDEMNLFEGSYTLEVSSPGLDYPLTHIRQYQKNIGRMVKVRLQDNSLIIEELEDVNTDGIKLKFKAKKSKEQEVKYVPFNEIKRTNVVVTFK